MKRISMKAGATIDGLNIDHVSEVLNVVTQQLEVVALGASVGSTLDLTISIKGSVLATNPAAMVAAHSDIGDALRLAVRGGVEIEEDLGIVTVREKTEPRKPASEKGGAA